MTSRLRNFGFLLKEVSRLHTLNFEQHAGGLNLSMTQSKVLCYLQRNEGISQVQLAQITDTDPMTLVRILDRMEADGLVERRPDPNDRRARCLYLLDAAGPVLKEIWRVSDKARAKSFTRMSAEDREHLVRLLEQMYANLGQPALGKLPKAAKKSAATKTPVARKSSAAVKKTVKE